MWIPEEGCTIGLCDGLSIVRRESEKGPVALMTPWEARKICGGDDLSSGQYPCFYLPLVTSQVVPHSSALYSAISIFEKFCSFHLVGDCCPKFDCRHYQRNVHASIVVLTFQRKTGLAVEQE